MTRQRFGWGLALAAVLVVGSACEWTETPEMAPQSDEAITTNIQARYFGDPEIKAYDVDVESEAGVVTLSGTVETEAARAQAAALAQQVEGVTRVQNDLRVEPPMSADADGGLDVDADADARDGEVGIAARDETPDQSARSDADDAVDGDADANLTDLDDQINAGWITMKIQAQYFGEDAVKGRHIDVDTSQTGRVSLKGEVETDAARQRAIEIARNTEGVTDVVDQLTVAGTAGAAVADADADDGDDADLDMELDDTWVTAKIESKYFLDDEVKGRNIDVTTENGIVTLTGEVMTAAERRQAVALARSTDGVTDVRDQLRITGDTMAADSGPMSRDSETAAAAEPVDDDWIETRIQSRYFLDNELKFGEIQVSSEQGAVVIEGQVPSEDVKEKAEEIARETSGVAEVENRLAVAGEPGSALAPAADPSQSAVEAPAGQ